MLTAPVINQTTCSCTASAAPLIRDNSDPFCAAADWEAARRLLPSLASSLAYSNYADWRAQHGDAEVADVVPGQLTLEDLYKATEREVRTTYAACKSVDS